MFGSTFDSAKSDKQQDFNERQKLFGTTEDVEFVQNTRNAARKPTPASSKVPAMKAGQNSVPVAVVQELAGPYDGGNATLLRAVRDTVLAPRQNEPSYTIPDPRSANIRLPSDFMKKGRTLARNIMEGTKDKDKDKPELLLVLMQASSDLVKPMRLYADLTAKALLVDVRREHLRERLEKHGNSGRCLPFNVRAKSNFMLGGTNFDTDVLSLTSGKDVSGIMIVGAHIKRPISKKDRYCPSVATAVASINSTALHFPGSARVQPTFDKYSGKKDGKRIGTGKAAHAIQGLTDMMVDRFWAWTAEGNVHPPSAILFYRDSINFDNAAVWTEYDEIRKAAKAVWPDTTEPPITYVVLNKNAQITQVPSTTSSQPIQDKRKVPVTPKMVFGTETDGPETYKYYVIENEMNLSKGELEELVSTRITHPL